MLWENKHTDAVQLNSFKDVQNYLKAKVKTYRGLEVIRFKTNPGLAVWAILRGHDGRHLTIYFGTIENTVAVIKTGLLEETPAVSEPIDLMFNRLKEATK